MSGWNHICFLSFARSTTNHSKMTNINKEGYFCRSYFPKASGQKDNTVKRKDWQLVKIQNNGTCGYIIIGKQVISLPKRYIGKRVRIKLEIIR